jgi:L-ascorbate metabolism protein UlaG (beta-lactamase superfamily)
MQRRIFLLLPILILTGCFHHRQREKGAIPAGPREATVQFLGHGCFQITSSLGLNILIDPFNPKVLTYPVKEGSIPADIVLVTHEDETANDTDLAAGSPQIVRSTMAAGVNRANGVLIRGVRTSSENVAAVNRLNVAYVWSMDGVRFCHLGVIEDPISVSEALNIGHVDVLFLPVGGPQAFTDDKRKITIERIRPRVIVPMMYSTAYSSKVPLRGLGDWLSHQSNIVRFNSNKFTISASLLPPNPSVYVLGAR